MTPATDGARWGSTPGRTCAASLFVDADRATSDKITGFEETPSSGAARWDSTPGREVAAAKASRWMETPARDDAPAKANRGPGAARNQVSEHGYGRMGG